MNIVKEIIKNQLIKLPFVRKKAQEGHSTGLNQNHGEVIKTIDFYNKFTSFNDEVMLEIGPGQTYQVAEEFSKICKSVSIIDIDKYIEDSIVKDLKIDYRIYDGKLFPFPNEFFTRIISYTVYEHIRYPQITVDETYRVLQDGGEIVHFVDLGDHFSYGVSEELIFNCLKYSKFIWNAMTFNRSSFVNRLRMSEWIEIHEKAGFTILKIESEESQVAKKMFSEGKLQYLNKIKKEDRFVKSITIHAKK